MSARRETARRTFVVVAFAAAAWPGAWAAQSAGVCTGPDCAAPWPEVAAIAQLQQQAIFFQGLFDAYNKANSKS